MVIPVSGAIGGEFSAMLMKAYLEMAAKLKPTVIVLDVDTPGGEIGEAEEIIDLLIAAKGRRLVALVHRALSAGAMVTMACKEIYMTEGATIGAAVSYRVGRDGMPVRMPADVAEKMQSVWRAVCRKAAEHGGHPSILAEAMVDPAFSLTMRRDGERVVVERDGAGDVLKAKGRVLTLTAREAVNCGLARGIVEDLAALGPRLGLTGWQVLETSRGRRREGGQAAPLEQSPPIFFDVLAQKATSLNTSDTQTDLQKAELKAFQAKAVETGRKDQAYRIRHESDMKELQNQITQLAAEIRRIEASPIWVAASSPDEPRLLVSAWFGASYKEALARVSPKSPLSLIGSVLTAKRYTTKDGITLIMAILDQCSMPGEGPAPTAVASGSQGTAPTALSWTEAEQAARNKLNLVRAFRRNGFPDKAEACLKQILADYPNTTAAEEARRQLQEVQEELKRAR
jgi:hypothetical protein